MNVEKYGTGTPILFIHGAGGSTLSWVLQMAAFERTNLVVLVDLPGHGGSSGKSSQSVDDYAEAVADVLAATGPAYIVGHSMGGAIALKLAAARPELVRGLVLMATGARLRVFPEILDGILKDKEKTSRMIIDTAFSKSTAPALKEKVLAEYLKNNAETVFDDFTACDGFNAMGSLGVMSVPTLVLCGAEDRLTPVKYSTYLAENIAGAELEIVEGAGHMVMLEKADAVNTAIARFVGSGR